jgi:hypothetical protein
MDPWDYHLLQKHRDGNALQEMNRAQGRSLRCCVYSRRASFWRRHDCTTSRLQAIVVIMVGDGPLVHRLITEKHVHTSWTLWAETLISCGPRVAVQWGYRTGACRRMVRKVAKPPLR